MTESKQFSKDGVWCNDCLCRTASLHYRIGGPEGMVNKKVGRICPSCKRYTITEPDYKPL